MSFAKINELNPNNKNGPSPPEPEFPVTVIIFIVAILLVTAIMTIISFKDKNYVYVQQEQTTENKPVPWPVSPMGQQFFFNQMMRRAGK
jgi:hypothetical protein